MSKSTAKSTSAVARSPSPHTTGESSKIMTDSKATTPEAGQPVSLTRRLLQLVEAAIIVAIFYLAAKEAYRIRLYAIKTYGKVIHEFDPWFNYRATEYLASQGASKFFTWFDHEVWSPLGRPVGTTIYPGMQFTAVYIWRVLNWLGNGWQMSLNDVCVFIPAWFGAIASVTLGLLTREVSGSWRAAAAATCVMAVVPAHLMRSVGGGYDNESVAMTAMCLTFFLWCRSLRTRCAWPIGFVAGLAYFYMGAAWGGYIFVGNMVAVHAALLIVLGRFSKYLHRAYSLWYIVGTLGLIQIPVINTAPFKSAEQLLPLAVFVGMQVLMLCRLYFAHKKWDWKQNRQEILKTYGYLFAACFAALCVLLGSGWFGPFSVRVRSLFIKHTQTGNPLVDSVAEHQPASAEAYWHFLHYSLYLTPFGFIVVALTDAANKKKEITGIQMAKYFIMLYLLIAYYFAERMNRLLILMGPVAASLAGVCVAWVVSWALSQAHQVLCFLLGSEQQEVTEAPVAPKKKDSVAVDKDHPFHIYGLDPFIPAAKSIQRLYKGKTGLMLRAVLAIFFILTLANISGRFWAFCDSYAKQSSHPSIMFEAKLSNGKTVMIDDYREAYWWLRDHTPTDSRVLAWWDYGYQINGIGNRTSLADGNTWNLEHIATLGRMLTAPEEKAHSLARHLADYVLIWAGNHGDDLAKSPHMARIGSSVYPDICPNDPLCYSFGFDSKGKPTPTMAASMLYKMHSNGQHGVTVNPKLFQEVYTSKYGLVRIYKILNVSEESKKWVADPANWQCDRPGSWYCPGQYPPGFPRPPKSHRNINYQDNRHYKN